MTSEPQFNFISCGSATYPPCSTCGPRKQSSYEFVLVTQGSLNYHYKEQQEFYGTNHLVLSRKGFNETYVWDKQTVSQHDFFHFDINHLNDIPADINAWPIAIKLSQDSLCFHLMKYILKLGQAQKHQSKEMENAIFLLIKNFIHIDNHLNTNEEINLAKEIKAVLSFLSKKWHSGTAHAIDLEELCRNTHTSATQLTRVFNKQYNKGPIQLIRLMRLKRASIQLRRTSMSIEEIALFNGFDNPFHFSKTFKKTFGLSPSYYRNQKRPVHPQEINNLPQTPYFDFN